MDERFVLPSWQDPGTDGAAEAPIVVHRYRLGLQTGVSVRSAGDGWSCTPERSAGGSIAAEEWVEAGEGDGAAQALVDLLRYEDLPTVPGFRVVRVTPPPGATGERAVDVDAHAGAHATVVVGERVAVAWTRRALDAPHPGARNLEHLAALDFIGVPELYGLLLWRTPAGNEVPVALVTRYLPRSRDGWEWAAELVDVAGGLAAAPVPVGTPATGIDLSAVELPARLGRLVAKLHVALATATAVDPTPTAHADAAAVLQWHAEARAEVEAARQVLVGDPANGTNGVGPAEPGGLPAAADRLEHLAAEVRAGRRRVVVQRIHADLHIGRVLRWTRGLAIVGFDAGPPFDPPRYGDLTPGLSPAARDLARLLASLAEVAHRASARPGMPADAPAAWYHQTREQVLSAYRTTLAAEERTDLFDEILLAGFEAAEHAHAVLARAGRRAAPDAMITTRR